MRLRWNNDREKTCWGDNNTVQAGWVLSESTFGVCAERKFTASFKNLLQNNEIKFKNATAVPDAVSALEEQPERRGDALSIAAV